MQGRVSRKGRCHSGIAQEEICERISREHSQKLVLPSRVEDELRPHKRPGVAASEFQRVFPYVAH